MSLPEGYRPREGDVLVLHAKVRFDVEPGDLVAHVEVGLYKRGCAVALDEIVGVHLRRWSKGDRVRWTDPILNSGDSRSSVAYDATVVAAADDHAWIKLGSDGSFRSVHANSLVPLFDPPEDDVPEAAPTYSPAPPPTAATNESDDDDIKF